ncbi:precorrin-2 C(20)-methyltransferase [Sulfoacidibacillus thermotolerans]|uniref:Precorrin-2 C(20)-methyltransferase n=1 Tax=Sulfoacidibacillus thermotolerans TaxID=1765684 RepID=A0A2U3DBV0_SULT2|nr:precorrin-2 C(20)-methyltransferase [Sulfoacidibacillus thermotolerans]PWI58732.1 precorrin-2 C(20)-methyltransferase [Sulfoacidibacillus thermotolerans]
MTTVSEGRTGTLYGIGVGPGDPELITIKAFRYLKQCQVIAYPKKRMGGRSYALDIVELYVDPSEKTMLGLVFPMTRDQEQLSAQWDRTVDEVCAHLLQQRDVAFVTEGDPMLYSTFIHMARRLKSRLPETTIITVPGVSSINAAAARLDVPLADGDEVVAIVPATDRMEDMRAQLVHHDCVVFLKVAKVLDPMISLLESMNLAEHAMVVTKVTSSEEVVWRNVLDLKGAELNYLTLMVVKKTC